jgi:hypothetical protein
MGAEWLSLGFMQVVFYTREVVEQSGEVEKGGERKWTAMRSISFLAELDGSG